MCAIQVPWLLKTQEEMLINTSMYLKTSNRRSFTNQILNYIHVEHDVLCSPKELAGRTRIETGDQERIWACYQQKNYWLIKKKHCFILTRQKNTRKIPPNKIYSPFIWCFLNDSVRHFDFSLWRMNPGY